MATNSFIYTNPEAARQAIAERQLQAALAENASREAIAHEQTQAQRYATQSQIAEREKDRQVSREDIAARYGANSRYTTDAAGKERSKLQFDTVNDKIRNNLSDPPTKMELDKIMSQYADLTDDQRKALQSLRDDAYNAAKSAAIAGEQKAKNYKKELDDLDKAKFPDPKARPSLYQRIGKDAKDVLFDASTGTVTSLHRMPRVDGSVSQAGILGDTRPGGVFPSASEMQAAGRPSGNTGAIPTIADVYKARSITGVPEGTQRAISPAQDYGGASLPPTVQALPNLSLSQFVGPAALRDPMQGPMQRFPVPGGFGMRASDIAPPSSAIPAPVFAPPVRLQSFDMPQYQSPAGNIDALIHIAQQPEFNTLPPAHQQMILDEIGNAAQRMPRVSDMDYSPPPPYYQ